MGDNSYGFYIPTFLKSQFPDWSPFQIGLLAAAPSVIAMVGMVLVGRHSDRTGERRWHVAGSAFTAALGWLMIAWRRPDRSTIPGFDSRWLFVVGVAVRLTGMKCMLPTFWTLPAAVPHRRRGRGRHRPDQFRRQPRRSVGAADRGHVKTASGSFTLAT